VIGLRFSDIEVAAANAAWAVLEGGVTRDSAIQAAEAATRVAEEAMAQVRQDAGIDAELKRIACAQGCSSCCHQVVAVTVAEAERIARFIAALPQPDRQAFHQRAKAAWAKGSGLDPAGWWQARIPCAALDPDGGCIIHPVRGLACRGYNSLDAEWCRQSLAGSAQAAPVMTAQLRIHAHAQMGLAKALARAGIHQPMGALAATLAALADQDK
jgi:Fe-S-cluster containining protein